MPFVVVESAGGPYEDESYIAGFEASRIDALLTQLPRRIAIAVRTPNLPQVDLIAMSHDYLVHRGEETESHTNIVLRPAPSRLTP